MCAGCGECACNHHHRCVHTDDDGEVVRPTRRTRASSTEQDPLMGELLASMAPGQAGSPIVVVESDEDEESPGSTPPVRANKRKHA